MLKKPDVCIQKKEMIMKQNHEYFHHCHASTIVRLPSGKLLTAYFAGTKEGAGDTAIWLSSKTSDQWQEPRRIIFQEGTAHWNPVLHVDGEKVWLFYKVGKTVPTWKTMFSISEDEGETWSESKELVPGDTLPRGPVKNKLIVLSNGHWLAPSSIEGERYWDAFVDLSPDQGISWMKQEDVPFEHKTDTQSENSKLWQGLEQESLWENDLSTVFRWDGVIQPTLWESEPGKVHMLLRSTRGKIFRSDSVDYGKTWCKAYPTELPNNNSGIDIVKDKQGRLVLVYNPVSGNWSERSPISISISEDNGITWSEPYHLETENGEFSYPAIICHEDHLHVTYTWNRKNIVYHCISLMSSTT